MTITSLPRYEVWPARYGNTKSFIPIPAQIRKVWYNAQGLRCMAFPVECDGHTEEEANETAAICAVALAAHFGGVADVSRVGVGGKRKAKR